jgi:hypothetical protein
MTTEKRRQVDIADDLEADADKLPDLEFNSDGELVSDPEADDDKTTPQD